ncbi:MAG: Gfo/Idh/MocA family oxidoreductase [Planctomycetes bacterium]|nr:Gfo/Idh/MocA family oxidoreductase [Planctomycetota bacterium]MBL7039203.1 Gfo/Idh/MocA family oxidoreductase [Pirellulaceae bacterium]
MEPVGYGIVGLGQVAMKGHIPELLRIPETHITALCDLSGEALAQAASLVAGAKTYDDFDAMLEDEDVEVVLIATPNWLHAEQAIRAFKAGKHVFLEKPIGVDLDECDAILRAWSDSGRLLQIGHELRHANLMRAMREKIDEGMIGQVQMVVVQEYRFPLLPGWRQTAKTGGVMLEKNSHFFDLFNWLADAPASRVMAAGGNNVNKESPLIDHCFVTVEYENSVRAALVMCLFAEHGSQLTIDVVGDKGRLIALAQDQKLTFYSRQDETPVEWSFEPGADGGFHMGFKTEHESFVRSLREGKPVVSNGPEARETMRVALAAERAVRDGTIVDLLPE